MVVGACSNDTGYVEIRASPASLSALPLLYLGTEKVEPRNGASVLRQPVGTMQLQSDAGGQMTLLCDVVVRKNRITTVTVSLVDRPPRASAAPTSPRSSAPVGSASPRRRRGFAPEAACHRRER